MNQTTTTHLAESRSLVTTTPDESLATAIAKMIANGYSQLPVVDANGTAYGLLTQELILHTLEVFDRATGELRTRDVRCEKFQRTTLDVPLDDLIEKFGDDDAIVIEDGQGKAVGLATVHDCLEYLFEKSRDLTNLEQIETTMRDLIREAHQDEDALREAIAMSGSPQANEFRLGQLAIEEYLNLMSGGSIDTAKANQAVHRAYEALPRNSVAFEDLSFFEYKRLFLSGKTWQLLQELRPGTEKHLEPIFERARLARNQLAHFRGALSAKQREEVDLALQWTRYFERQLASREASQAPIADSGTLDSEVVPEAPLAADTPFLAFAQHLQGISPAVSNVSFLISDIDAIIGGRLPEGARRYSAWWRNDANYRHAKYWMDAGWRARRANIDQGTVDFYRVTELNQAYTLFFTGIRGILASQFPNFPKVTTTPGGENYYTVAKVAAEGQAAKAFYGFAFSFSDRFRTELYLSTGSMQTTKAVFDDLRERFNQGIMPVPHELTWERLDGKQASRIAIYRPGSVKDAEDVLVKLQQSATESVVNLYEYTHKHVLEALKLTSSADSSIG